MTDMVSLNHRQSGGMYTDEAVPAFQPHTSTLVAAMPSRPTNRYRMFFIGVQGCPLGISKL